MRRKVSKLLVFILVVFVMVGLLTACGGKKMADDGMMMENAVGGTENYGESSEISDTVSTADKTTNVRDNRKIIEKIELSIETKEFDALLESLDNQIATLNGYVESSDIYGREFDSYENRSANMKIRIPADKSKDFSDYISKNSVVVSRSVTTEDVTLTYVDIESRVNALTAEKESLEALLKKAKTVEEIVTVRDKLTEVIYEIESYQSQLRTYDNLVDYCTVTLYIDEVERTTVVEEQNVWQEIGTNLETNFANVWDGIVALFVFAVSAIPYLIPFIIIGIIVLIPITAHRRKKRNQQEKNHDEQ